MRYVNQCASTIGGILLAADETGLTGLWFEGQKYYARTLEPKHEEGDLPVFGETKKWLDIYFSGQEPDFMPAVHMIGTEFQIMVWEILRQIPYGEVITYGDIARRIAERKGLGHMSAQAAGGAVGHNKISIIVPCHRVVGADGNLTGYAGGLDRKMKLLELEKADMDGLFVPKKER